MRKQYFFAWIVATWAINSCTLAYSQNLPQPKVWFSFNNLDANSNYNAEIGSGLYCDGLGHTQQSDRFSATNTAVNLNDPTGFLSVSSGKLFGAVSSGNSMPDNFTISFWVKAARDINDTKYHKLFFGGLDNSPFALLYNGSKGELFLRRWAHQTHTCYDYRFWAPAAFDIPGDQSQWYHIILVMGKRIDGMKFMKLYVGKNLLPGEKIKYDATGPRIVNDPDDILAMDFGGGYAQFGQQHVMEEIVQWGFGNADPTDQVHGSEITASVTIDDFAVWDVALTENQAKELFDCQRNNAADQCWSSSPALKIASPTAETREPFVVFPNPATDQITIVTNQSQSGRGYFELSNMEGKPFSVHEQMLNKGRNQIELTNLKARGVKSGVYFLHATTPSGKETVKIVIE